MGDRRDPRRCAIVSAAALSLAVAGLLLVPVPSLPGGAEWSAEVPFDKLVHAGLFFLQGVAWARTLTNPETRAPRFQLVLVVALGAYGALLELAQGATGWRTASWGDLAADALGAALALGYSALRQPAATDAR